MIYIFCSLFLQSFRSFLLLTFLFFFWPEGIVWLYTQIYALTLFLDFDVFKKKKKWGNLDCRKKETRNKTAKTFKKLPSKPGSRFDLKFFCSGPRENKTHSFLIWQQLHKHKQGLSAAEHMYCWGYTLMRKCLL